MAIVRLPIPPQLRKQQLRQPDKARKAVVLETETRTRVLGMRSQVPWHEPSLTSSSYWGSLEPGGCQCAAVTASTVGFHASCTCPLIASTGT
jgi:hypothetical protein